MKYDEVRSNAQENSEKLWDTVSIGAVFKEMREGGLAKRGVKREEIGLNRENILERVQQRGEEYEFMSHSCAKGAALAVIEEFGLGNMEVIKALSPFPGLSLTGRICGAVSGGLIALGLYFGSDDLLNYKGNRIAMAEGRKFLERFEERMGSLQCEEIQKIIFGSYLNPWGNSAAFTEAKGYERCSAVAGGGARVAAEIIIDNILKGDSAEEPKKGMGKG